MVGHQSTDKFVHVLTYSMSGKVARVEQSIAIWSHSVTLVVSKANITSGLQTQLLVSRVPPVNSKLLYLSTIAYMYRLHTHTCMCAMQV